MRTQKQQQHLFRFRLAYIAFSSRYTWNQSLPIRWKANRSCLRASLQCCSLLHLIQDPMLRLAASADALCLGTYLSYVVSTDGTGSPCASDRDRARNSPANEVKTEWTVGRATIPVEADPSYASSVSGARWAFFFLSVFKPTSPYCEMSFIISCKRTRMNTIWSYVWKYINVGTLSAW